ncbi:SWIM zinc finger protein [Xylariales sp. AK1849]|nr:SWIM zinc finger protein [Xylariales sp. AK1849]
MPPTTRLQSRSQGVVDSSDESDDDFSETCFNEAGNIVFPSKLAYSLAKLDEDTRQHIVDAMDVPRQLVLQECRARDDHVIFQVAEVVEHSVRTGGEDSPYPTPSCSCEEEVPCRHILWLFDQITRQIVDDLGHPLVLNRHGYSEELTHPFNMISEFHLDILADSLHSKVSTSPGPTNDHAPNPRRVQEVREILASLNAIPIDEYRPDLFDSPNQGRKVIKRRDLECTIFRMMLRNNEFFNYFRSSMRTDELVNNPFRKLEQRADAALAGFDAYARNNASSSKNVQWLADWEYRGAARTLIHIMRAVVKRNKDVRPENQPHTQRNLYFNLIGDTDQQFVVDVLNLIPPASMSQFVPDIEQVLEEINRLGAPETYIERLRGLLRRIRGARSASASGSKRQAGGHDRSAKRMK